MPPAIVLDTNVVLDWLVFADPSSGPLAAAIQRTCRWTIAAASGAADGSSNSSQSSTTLVSRTRAGLGSWLKLVTAPCRYG